MPETSPSKGTDRAFPVYNCGGVTNIHGKEYTSIEPDHSYLTKIVLDTGEIFTITSDQ